MRAKLSSAHVSSADPPAVGQIKGARGLDRFRLRGLEKVNGEWALMATTHNLLKLFPVSITPA
ncbi:transposase [Synechococcus sp. CBW1006]|nr:transposase [Synechococcus sp. CBW1006]